MRGRWGNIGLAMAAAAVAIWLGNTNLLVPSDDDIRPKLLAHRGVHQNFAGDTRQVRGCTANPIAPVTHGLIENTLPSMQAAFEAGADVVEIDVYLLKDGVFAVFHDWGLECRTNGQGQTAKKVWSDLSGLDVAYGYTVDGETFPLRGTGVGLMPRLEDVFEAFPDRQFLVNTKGGSPEEGRGLAAFFKEHPDYANQTFGVYGWHVATTAFANSNGAARVFNKKTTRKCGLWYLALGWSGYVPKACHNTIVGIPSSWAGLVWGWPQRFVARMNSVNTDVFTVQYIDGFTEGVDTATDLSAIHADFKGFIWTDRIEVIGPLVNAGK